MTVFFPNREDPLLSLSPCNKLRAVPPRPLPSLIRPANEHEVKAAAPGLDKVLAPLRTKQDDICFLQYYLPDMTLFLQEVWFWVRDFTDPA